MSEKENKKAKQNIGPKWTYESASEERAVLENDETLQVKVRRRHTDNNYTVHFRKNPAIAPEKKVKKKEKSQKKKHAKKQS